MSTNNVILGGEMHAPEQESGFKRREGLEIPDEGPQEFLCIGVVQLGTHLENYQNKEEKIQPKIMLIWEKCDLKQLVYEEDTEPRSFVKYDEMTFYTNTKARLYKVAKAVFGKEKSEDDITSNNINFLEMLGRRVYLNIEHKESAKGITYPNISSYSVCKKAADPDFISDGNQYGWYFDKEGKNFMHPAFANLPKFLRDKIKESDEGKAHAAAGGTFAEPEKQEENSSTSSSAKVKEVGVPEGWVFEDPNKEGTYSEFLAVGWDNKQLAAKGYLKKIEKPKGPSAPPKPEDKKPEPPKPSTPTPTDDDDDYNPFAGDDDDDLPF